MSELRTNIVANLAGQGWSGLMGLVFIPLYIKFMGIEAYGLVGFYALLQYALNLLDFGLTPTMNREMARYSAQPDKAAEARDLVRTLEGGYWALGLLLGAMVIAGAPLISKHWVKPGAIQISEVEWAVKIMGVVSALQWPLSFYQGGLLGLQRQVLLNGLNVAIGTLRGGGAVLILWLISPTITAFFVWQIIVSALQVTVTTFFLWRSLPPSDHSPRFNWNLLKNIWRFAAGMSGTIVMASILRQLDKVILSKLLSLEMFGYYTLAGTVGSALGLLSGPVFTAFFPRLTGLVALGDRHGLTTLYHRGCQLIAVLVLPVGMMLSLFSYELLRLWTRNEMTARVAAPITSILVIGTILNSLAGMPFDLQVAHGWTRLGFYKNSLAVLVAVPTTILLAERYGAVGAAAVWVMLNCGYVLIEVPVMHRRLLAGEMRRWYLEDVGLPLLATAAVTGLARWVMPRHLAPLNTAFALAMISLIALACCIISAQHIRAWVFEHLGRRNAAYGA